MSLFSVHKTIHPSTCVEFCVYCDFLGFHGSQLVTCGANVLRVYQLVPDQQELSRLGAVSDAASVAPKMRLSCVFSASLHGRPLSVNCVRFAGSVRHSLLFAFADAKLTIAEYSPLSHDLAIVTMHCYENEETRPGCLQVPPPCVRVDPENRCAVMLLYGQRIAVIPFRREVSYEDESGTRRSPVLPTYVIDLASLDTRISNVIDMQFLHGYYEPTLAFLFEPLRTYSGRLAVRRDTCQFVAVSLNTCQRVHPVIWSVQWLPFDCVRVLPVPLPQGGALLLAVNSAIYINQSVPAYAVALNSAAEASTHFPLKTIDGVKVTMDGAQCVFVSHDQLILSLRSGELYMLAIVADSLRAVRSITLERSASSVLTSCMALCDGQYLFLGSRLGNSLLLRVQEKCAEDESSSLTKRRRLDELLSTRDTLDLEELEVYGDEDVTQTTIKQYSFEVCDSVLNLSPCGQLVMGQPPFLSEEFVTSDDPDIELVVTSGFGKNGALSVLQRSVRPQVVTTFALPGCVDMWTLLESGATTTSSAAASGQHAFLLLSQPAGTMVLQTDEAISELDNSGFVTGSRTVLAATLANNRLIVQVTISQVILLSGSRRLDAVSVNIGGEIVAASVADPYTIVFTDRCQVALLEVVNDKLSLSVPDNLLTKDLVLASAFVDESGLFTTEVPPHVKHVLASGDSSSASASASATAAAGASAVPSLFSASHVDVDDEDEMLYGESTLNASTTVDDTKQPASGRANTDWLRWQQRPQCSQWLILAYRSGDALLHRLPDCRVTMRLAGLGRGLTVLGRAGQPPAADDVTPDHEHTDSVLREVVITCLGHMRSRPVLAALLDNDQLLLYEAFACYAPSLAEHQLKVLFRRVSHSIVAPTKSKSCDSESPTVRVCQLRPFDNVSGFRGMFICGANPHWLLMSSRGELRLHPMTIDGRVQCLAGFNNVNCPLGFLYFNRLDELRICVLPSHILYDSNWPMRKTTLRRTPHFLCYHLETKTYLVCTSHAQPSMNVYKFTGDDKELSVEDRGDRFPYPLQKTFTIQLYSPVSWEVVPKASIDLQEWETVTAMKNVSLTYEGHRSGQRVYVAVGTNMSYGEDVVCHGKVILLDIIEVVPEPGQPLTRYKLKTILQKEQTAPVSAVGAVCGYLLGAVGQKLYVWSLKNDDLVGLAFIDTQMYIHQLHAIKSLILAGDVWKSLCVLRFQSEFRTLSVVGRDFRCRDICAVEFMVDNTQVGFMTTDYECNALVFVYQPESRDSCGGLRLIRRSDFQLSSRVHTLARVRCRLNDTSAEKKHPPIVAKRHITFYANTDGGLGMFLPVPEKTYRRLMVLQALMNTHCAHALGLNPRAFRTYCSRRHEAAPPARGVLDGDLLFQFVSLPLGEQLQLTRRAALRSDVIHDDLALIGQLTAVF